MMSSGGLARLGRLLSWRTISGKLIIGLFVLFGLASAAVGVVTAQSLENSLMSSQDGQLQAATNTWLSCVNRVYHVENGGFTGPPGRNPGGGQPEDGYAGCSDQGQPPGTFEVVLGGQGITYWNYVLKSCTLSVADQTMLTDLPAPAGQGASSGPTDPDGQPGNAGLPGAAPGAQTYDRTLDSVGIPFLFTKVPGPGGTEVVTGLPMTTVDATLGHVEDTEYLLFSVALLLAVVLGGALVQLSLRPLRRVAVTATQVTELPLDSGEVTLPAGVPDTDPRTEVGQVGAAFNRMLQHVERALGRRAASEARLRRFAADASHELRTPLSSIRGYAELALRHPGPVPEAVTHALGRVQSESVRMSVLVDDLLLLARLDAGRPLERAPVDLSRLAIDVTSDARVARPDHQWRLELPGDPVVVRGDEHRLHQVLANLMSNAGQHTPPGSTVIVALTTGDAIPAGEAAGPGAVRRGVTPSGPRAELSITDDGPGVPPELLPELFERFTRADTSRARDAHAGGKSTGLGLAIVDAVVAAHGGSITVTSRPGLTRFAIVLPLMPEPADQPGLPDTGDKPD
ncbi:MAG TPA: HAMP domain-containing sensor histidine kinase [Streptosporangiaceae bacterium]|nr:HAMP domain-containing sensor histidine kinase [Streptosporangiaceae bacterium]